MDVDVIKDLNMQLKPGDSIKVRDIWNHKNLPDLGNRGRSNDGGGSVAGRFMKGAGEAAEAAAAEANESDVVLHIANVSSRDSRLYLLTPVNNPSASPLSPPQSPPPPPKPPPRKLVMPSFDAPFGVDRAAVCIDASTSHARGEENNTRWSLYAIPNGTPPAGGWPVLLSLMPWGVDPTHGQHNITIFGGNRTCGNGWTPHGYFNTSCIAWLKVNCPVHKNETIAACSDCVASLMSKNNGSNWANAGCASKALAEEAWCLNKGVNQDDYQHYPTPATFDPPGK